MDGGIRDKGDDGGYGVLEGGCAYGVGLDGGERVDAGTEGEIQAGYGGIGGDDVAELIVMVWVGGGFFGEFVLDAVDGDGGIVGGGIEGVVDLEFQDEYLAGEGSV